MSGGKRFRWMRLYMKPKRVVDTNELQEVVDTMFWGIEPKGSNLPGSWKRPFCAKCGKKIRNIQKLVYRDGKPYHKKCLE